MSQAKRVAFGRQRFRVVTLNGDMCEVSGAMSGGGAKKCGKMGSQVQAVDDTDLKALERALRKDEEQMSRVSERRQELDHRLHASRRELGERERALKKLQVEVSGLKEEAKILESQIVTQEKHVVAAKPDEARVADMTQKIDALRAEYEEAM